MNSYAEMIGSINKLYYDKTTSISPDAIVYDNVWNIQWNNQLAIQRVYEVSKLLDRGPDILGEKPGQSAIWYNPETKVGKGHYHKFEIHDQAYQHTKPARHADFFFVWLRMKMKPEKAANINKITTSAFYYDPGQLVCGTCHFIEASIATFSVLKDYNDDKINLEEARQVYDNRISELTEEFLWSEQSEDIGNYPTPLRDILETYIVSDMVPDEVFQGCSPDQDMLVVSMETTEAEILTPTTPITSMERMLEADNESISFTPNESDIQKNEIFSGMSGPPITSMSETELIRELTMNRLELELRRKGVDPRTLTDEVEVPDTITNTSNNGSGSGLSLVGNDGNSSVPISQLGRMESSQLSSSPQSTEIPSGSAPPRPPISVRTHGHQSMRHLPVQSSQSTRTVPLLPGV